VWAALPSPPELVSVFPFGGQQGAEFSATVRGRSLDGITGVWFDCEHLSATVSGVEREKAAAGAGGKGKGSSGAPLQLLSLKIKPAAGAPAGLHYMRVLSAGGLSNPLPVRVHAEPSLSEDAAAHGAAEQSQRIPEYPVVVNGKLGVRGEVDFYAFDAEQGETVRFDALTAGGGFDPSLTLYAATGSWFRPDRLNELAFNDEAVSYPGLPLHATLTYQFPRKGRYFIRLNGFLGEGGPDQAYQLSIRRAVEGQAGQDLMQAAHMPPPADDLAWKERVWKRELKPDRLKVLWSRAVESLYSAAPAASKDGARAAAEAGNAIPEIPVIRIDDDPHGASSAPVPVTIPALIEGTIEQPADIDRVRFKVKGGDRIALEIETPNKTIPQFNPYLRVVSTSGDEAFTNVHSRVNTCGDTIIKQVEPKTTYSFPRDGEFILEIRDITHLYGERSFTYRVLLRQQVPHMGEVRVAEDQVNLVAGEVSKISISTDQEEGYDGFVALTMEGLPAGVRAVMGTELEPAVPAPFNPGKIERFRTESQKATFLLLSDATTPGTSAPVEARVMAQPSMKGKIGRPILVKKILFTVVQPGAAAAESRASSASEGR
jgi:hypothetical protein